MTGTTLGDVGLETFAVSRWKQETKAEETYGGRGNERKKKEGPEIN